MAIDKQIIKDMAQADQKRRLLLKRLGIEEVPTTLSPARLGDSISHTASGKRYFMDKQENQYCLPSDKYHKFNEFLDRIVKENSQNNGEELVKEFLEPFKTA